MQEDKKHVYGIIGVGAVGGFYGAKLQKAGFEVHSLFKELHYPHIYQHGMQICSSKENIILSKVNAYKQIQEMPACDIIIVALKTTQNIFLKDLLPSLVKEGTLVLVLQNGLGNEEYISKIVPNTPILTGITTIGAYKEGPGKVRVFKEGLLKIAHYQEYPGITEQVNNIVQDFRKAEIETFACEDYLQERFQKLLWNVCFNGLSALYNITADKIIENHAELLKEIAQEFIEIAASYNRAFSFSVIEEILVSKPAVVGYKPSMLIDYENNKPMEIEYIYGKLILAAQKKGVACPILEGIYRQLKKLEKVQHKV